MSDTNRNRTTPSNRASSAGRTTSGRNASGRPSGKSSADRIQAVQNARNMGNGGRPSGRSTSGRRRKKRKRGPDVAKLLLIAIGTAIFLLCLAVGVRSCSKSDGDKESDAMSQEETTTLEPETEISAEITVNGISVNGLTKSEARERILKDIDWGMKVSYKDNEKELPDLMALCVDAVLDEVYSGEEPGDYTVEVSGVEEAVREQVNLCADEWDVQPRNGSISSYDKSTNEFIFSGAQKGSLINRDQLMQDIIDAMEAGQYRKAITAAASEVEPEITEEQAKASFKRLGTFTTTTTSNKDRNENIRIASSAINGIIIHPGEEFSFNLTTGNRTTDKGYRPAGAYQNGVLVEEPGGGVCQVSSTLYNAVVFAGLKTTERHAHSYEPSYVTPGEDAMVSYDGYSGPDMKFVNNSKTAVGIKTSFSNQKLTISIYGNPILAEGVTLSMHSQKVKELDPPAPEYVEDPTLELDVEVEVKKATPGSSWVTNLVTKKDGEVVSEIKLHNSVYNGKPATIKRNTSGSVLTTEGESVSPSGSSSGESSASESSPQETTAQSPSESSPGASQPSQSYPNGPGNDQPSQEPSTAPPIETGTFAPGPGDETQMTEPTHGGPIDQENGPGAGLNSPGPQNIPQTSPQPSDQFPPAQTQAPSDMGLISPIG